MSGAKEMLCGDGNEGCDLNSEDGEDFASAAESNKRDCPLLPGPRRENKKKKAKVGGTDFNEDFRCDKLALDGLKFDFEELDDAGMSLDMIKGPAAGLSLYDSMWEAASKTKPTLEYENYEAKVAKITAKLIRVRHQLAAQKARLKAEVKATEAGIPIDWSVRVLFNGKIFPAVVDQRTSKYIRVLFECGKVEKIYLFDIVDRITFASPIGSGSKKDPVTM